MKQAPAISLFLVLASAEAFVTTGRSSPCCGLRTDHVQVASSVVDNAEHDDRRIMSRRDWVGMMSSAAFVIPAVTAPRSAEAQAMDSSSVYMADSIKTMDMGLPSYGTISNPKANSETLTTEYEEPKEAKVKKERSKPSPKDDSDEGENPLAFVLPSMNKSNKKPAKAAPAPSAPKPKAEKESSPQYEIVDFSLPSYSGETGAKQKSVFSL